MSNDVCAFTGCSIVHMKMFQPKSFISHQCPACVCKSCQLCRSGHCVWYHFFHVDIQPPHPNTILDAKLGFGTICFCANFQTHFSGLFAVTEKGIARRTEPGGYATESAK